MSDVTLRQITDRGMITLRADFTKDAARAALTKATGAGCPEPLRLSFQGATSVAWMSPDEVMVMVPRDDCADTANALKKAFARQHALIHDMSDARVIFRLEGPGARAALMRLTPADVSERAFVPGDFRRARMAQVPAGLWMRDDGAIGVMCFRSVASYMSNLLETAVASESAA